MLSSATLQDVQNRLVTNEETWSQIALDGITKAENFSAMKEQAAALLDLQANFPKGQEEPPNAFKPVAGKGENESRMSRMSAAGSARPANRQKKGVT